MSNRVRGAVRETGVYLAYSWWQRNGEVLRSYRRPIYVIPIGLFLLGFLILPLERALWAFVTYVVILSACSYYAVYVWWTERRRAGRVTN